MEISFKDVKKTYHFKINEFGLEYESKKAQIVIERTNCNAEYFEILNSEIKRELKTRSISSNPEKTFMVKKNGKTVKILKESSLGFYLYHLDKKLTHLRLKEKIHCNN